MIKEIKFSLGCGKIKGEISEKVLKLPQPEVKVKTLVKMLLFVLVAGLFASCAGDGTVRPVAGNIDRFEVEKLFEVDSIAVYRFLDAGCYVYFTSRKGEVYHKTTHSHSVGKTHRTETKHHQTLCN